MADSPLAHSPTLAAASSAGSEAASPRLPPGTNVGEYLVDEFLGAGAMGEVYAGHHPVIGKKVAIKVLRRELATSEEAAERFTREARAGNQVDHPNVIDVFAYGRLEDGRLYLVMDLCPGTSLRARLAAGALPIGEALEILEPIADALDAAHTRGVIHRDLKPDNIMVSATGPLRVFVLDFGIAKLVSKANEGRLGNGTLTGQGTWLGTPAYMAPEQWSTDGAGPASDRYALGVIAFELLSGALPFAASSVPGMMEQHFRAEIPALSAHGLVSSAVDDVVRRGLAKDPEARYPTAQAFVEALRVAAGTRAGRGGRGAVAIRDEAPKRPWLAAALGVGVLGVGVAGVLAVRGGDDRDRMHAAPAVDPDADTVAIDLTSTPDNAAIFVGDRYVEHTPHTLHVKPNATVELAVRKPGYLPNHQTLKASSTNSAIAVSLGEVTSFQGVWKLPDGRLRAFERKGDKVAVFKLDEVAGPREYWKSYPFVDAETGVKFGADDEVVDDRAPNDLSCRAPVHVEYRFDTTKPDTLELQRPNVIMDFVGGHCVPRSRELEISRLERVDKASDTRSLPAPVGMPDKGRAPPFPFTKKTATNNATDNAKTKLAPNTPPKTLKIDPTAAIKQKSAKAPSKPSNKPFDTVGKKPTSPYTTTKASPVDNIQADRANNAQDQQANPPAPQANPQTQQPPPQQAPMQQLVPKPTATPPDPAIEDLKGGKGGAKKLE